MTDSDLRVNLEKVWWRDWQWQHFMTSLLTSCGFTGQKTHREA